jgi:hypothetical protein
MEKEHIVAINSPPCNNQGTGGIQEHPRAHIGMFQNPVILGHPACPWVPVLFRPRYWLPFLSFFAETFP